MVHLHRLVRAVVALGLLAANSCQGNSSGPSENKPDGSRAADAATAEPDGVAGELLVPDAASVALPALPSPNVITAQLWASIPVSAVRRVRMRDDIIYVAADPEPLRIDCRSQTYRKLGRPADASQLTQDIVVPIGGSRIVTIFASASEATIRSSRDDGATWMGASGPPATSGIPSSLVSFPDTSSGPGRTFMAYGGTSLEVSDDGGRSWTLVIPGGSVPAQGFTLNGAGTTLWCVAEAVPDRVASFWLNVTSGQSLPSVWQEQVLDGWDANGVYSAEGDPFAPLGIYIGGEGRLGYLRPDTDGGIIAESRWVTSPEAGPYTYIVAILPSSTVADSVVFGGGEQGGGPARVLEAAGGGAATQDVVLDGSPSGTVRGIVRADTRLLFFVDTGAALEIYAISR